MKTVLKVSERGTLTLPREFRRKLAIEGGGQLILEDSGDGIRLRPVVTIPLEAYTDERIAEFDAAESRGGIPLPLEP